MSLLSIAPVQAVDDSAGSDEVSTSEKPTRRERSAKPAESVESAQTVNIVKATDSDDDGTLDAPDVASAVIGAEKADKPVEDLSQRSETSTVAVNPDGSRTLRQFQVPVRIKRDGEWVDVDQTLEKQADGTYRPKASAADVVIGGGGSKDAGKVTFEDGSSVAVTWPETLPEPKVEGGVATYKLSETTDLLMVMTGNGVAARLRLNERPKEDDPIFTFGLRTEDLTVDENPGGGLALKDDQGKLVGGASKLVAWDAKTDEAGEPLEKVALSADLDQTGKSGDIRTHDLDVSTPEGFLSDPTTKFPVIVDPDVTALEAARDTWVRRNDFDDHNVSTFLNVGKRSNTGNTYPTISYMQWYLGNIPEGSTVTSARLLLHQFWASSCAPTQMNVQPVTSQWNASIRWPERPDAFAGDYQYLYENKGFQCPGRPPGRVSIPATTWINNWRNHTGGYSDDGLRLGVPVAAETDIAYQRRFCSYNYDASYDANCPNSSFTPTMEVTYNNPPNTPTNLDVTLGGNPATVYATVSDPNSETALKTLLRVTKASSGAQVWSGYTNSVAGPGPQQVSARLPYLPDGDFKVTAQAYDDNGFASGVSAAKSFTIETEFGIQSWFSMTEHRLTDRSSIAMNNRTGNVVIRADDVQVNGEGLDLNISRFYNSQSVQTNAQNVIPASGRWQTSMGPGWTLSVGPDVWLQRVQRNGYDFTYHAPGGTVFGPFVHTTSTKFKSPKGGVGADLTKDGDIYTLKFRKSQLRYEFKEYGDARHLFQHRIVDRSGNDIKFAYSGTTPNGRAKLTTITDASERQYAVTYVGDSITKIEESFGDAPRDWQYQYTTTGDLVRYTDPADIAVEYASNVSTETGARLVRSAQGPQSMTYFDYNTTGVNVDRLWLVGYTPEDWNYNDWGWDYKRRTSVGSCNDGSDYSTTVQDANSMNMPAATAKKSAYCFQNSTDPDEGGRVRVYDANNNMKQSTYTADKGPAEITTPLNSGAVNGSTQATYSAGLSDQLESVAEPKSDDEANDRATTKFGYDHTQAQSGSSAPAGGQYLPATVKNPNGNCSAYEYDNAGRTTAAYTGLAYQSCDKSEKTGFHRRYNDSNGTVSESWDANAYNAADLNEDDEPDDSRKTLYTYWGANQQDGSPGQVKTIRKPGGSCDAPRKLCTSYTYDGVGRVTSVTDGRNTKTSYTYDLLDRPIKVVFNGATDCDATNSNCVKYTYDAQGNLTKRIDGAGTSTFTFDWLGRQTKQVIPGAVIDLGYDRNGNLTSHKQTLTGQAADTVAYTYDVGNRLTKVHSNTLGAGAAGDIVIRPDNDGRVKQIEFPGSDGILVNYDHKRSGKPKSANVKAKASGNVQREHSYDYVMDLGLGISVESGQLQERTVADAPSGNGTTGFEYVEERLESATGAGADFEYTHDKVGNVLSEGSAGVTTYFGYDRAGQLCWRGQADGTNLSDTCGSGPAGSTDFSHDGAGNNTNFASNQTVYNDDSQVTTIDGVNMGYLDRGNDLRTTAGGVSYVNSPLGVTAKKEGTNITYYVRDTQGSILASYGASGTLFYFSEFNGSVAALYNPAGNEVGSYKYSPYGKTIATGTAAENNPFRYIGGLQDKDNNGSDSYYKLGARYYDTQGHFTQPDAIAGTINNPRTLTRYNYAGGDPINSSDPSGYISVGDIAGGVLGTAVAVGGGAAICAATGGVGCVIGAVGYGAIGGGLGAAVGSEIDGDPDSERAGNFFDGVILGTIGGLFTTNRG